MTYQRHCATINYVLCSSYFEDVVLIHPIDIDKCDINVNNENYTLPTKKEIRNAYFKHLKQNSKRVKCQMYISIVISLTPLM